MSRAAGADDRPGGTSSARTGWSARGVCSHGFGARQAGAQRQNGLRPVQCLNLGLLVDAQDDGIGRRIHVETDDVVDLVLGVGISAELERLDPMRLEVVRLQIR